MLNPETIAIVKATAPVLKDHALDITGRMYEVMFAERPDIRAMFVMSNQHDGGQPATLARAVHAYAANIDNLGALEGAVRRMAHRHVSLHVRPEHYPVVGHYLLGAIKDVLGDAANEQVLGAWKEAYEFLANLLIDVEGKLYDAVETQPGGWRGWRRFTVDRRVRESDLIASFYLKPADGGAIASFEPGQYVTVRADVPVQGAVTRNYSLSDRPGLDHYRITVKREPVPFERPELGAGLLSNFLHDRVEEGDTLELGPALGDFTLDLKSDRPIVLLGGGVGLTPLVSMLHTLAARGDAREAWLIHGAINGRVHALRDEVRALAERHGNIRKHFRYERPARSDVVGRDYDSAGRIDLALLRNLLGDADRDFYLCGPLPFMRAMHGALASWDVPAERVRTEFFGPAGEVTAAA